MEDTNHSYDENYLCTDISYEEDEVFFGKISERESRKVKDIPNRKTEHYYMEPGPISIGDREELVESLTDTSDLKVSNLPILSGEECQSQLLAIINEVEANDYNSEELQKLQNSLSRVSLNSVCTSFQNNYADESFKFDSNIINNDAIALFQLREVQSKPISEDIESLGHSLFNPVIEECQPLENVNEVSIHDIVKVHEMTKLERYKPIDSNSDNKIAVVYSDIKSCSEIKTYDFSNSNFIRGIKDFNMPLSIEESNKMENSKKEMLLSNIVDKKTFCIDRPISSHDTIVEPYEHLFTTFTKGSEVTQGLRNFENICFDSDSTPNMDSDHKDHIQTLTTFDHTNLSFKHQRDLIVECNTNSLKELYSVSDLLNNLSDENNSSTEVLQTNISFEVQTADVTFNQQHDLKKLNLDIVSTLEASIDKEEHLIFHHKESAITICQTRDENCKENKLASITMEGLALLSVNDSKILNMKHPTGNSALDTSLNLLVVDKLVSDQVNLEFQANGNNEVLKKRQSLPERENLAHLSINFKEHHNLHCDKEPAEAKESHFATTNSSSCKSSFGIEGSEINLTSNIDKEKVIDYTKSLPLKNVNTTDYETEVVSTVCKGETSGLLESRQSYFCSLDISNINNDKMFQGFIIDDRIGPVDSITENNGNSCKIKCIKSCHENVCDDYEKSEMSDSLGVTISNGTNGLNVTVGNSADDGSKNYALLLSNNGKKKFGLQFTTEEASDEVKIPCNDLVESLDNPFNDTIEEMELLLKHGDKYFQGNETYKVVKQDSKETPVSNEDESILSPTKKHSVASAESATTFVPNLDSTRASSELDIHSEILGKNSVKQIRPTPIKTSLLNRSLIDNYSNKEPPSKPPHNIHPHSTSSHSFRNLNNEDITIENNCLPNNTLKVIYSTPISNKVTGVHATASLKTKPIRQICSNTVHMNSQGTPINKTLKFKTVPTSTPCSIYLSNEKKLIYAASIENLNSCLQINTPKNSEANKMKSYSLASRTVKAERVGCKITQKPFLTPFLGKGYLRREDYSNTFSNQQKVRGLNIVSPVAKYLQDNPPPPLIATIKPKNRPMISPITTQKTPINLNSWSAKSDENPVRMYSPTRNLDASMLQRDETIEKINDNMRKLTFNVNSRNVAASNMMVAKFEDNCLSSQANRGFYNKSILPSSVYIPGNVHKLENKENIDHRREISSNKPPNAILKHKGRIQVPKPAVLHLLTNKDSSTTRLWHGLDKVNDTNSSGRVSLMEVSVNEAASVHHTNTLH